MEEEFEVTLKTRIRAKNRAEAIKQAHAPEFPTRLWTGELSVKRVSHGVPEEDREYKAYGLIYVGQPQAR